MEDRDSARARYQSTLERYKLELDIFFSEFTACYRDLESWNTPLMPNKKPFVDWGRLALDKLGEDEVPIFDSSIHLKSDYTGFVRKLIKLKAGPITPFDLPVEEADYAYLDGGVITYTQRKRSKADQGAELYEVSWRRRNFRVDETYLQNYHLGDTKPKLTTRLKTGTDIYTSGTDRENIRVKITQDEDDAFVFRIDNMDKFKNDLNWGPLSVIQVDLKKGDYAYKPVRDKMQKNPRFFEKPKQLFSLLAHLKAAPNSTVLYGFENGEYPLNWNMKQRKIPDEISFAEALSIAFPDTYKREYQDL